MAKYTNLVSDRFFHIVVRLETSVADELSLPVVCGFLYKKIKFSIKDFFSRCDQIRWKLRIWSHLLQQSLMEKFHFLCRGWDDVWDKKKLKKFQIMLSEKMVGAAVTIENNLEQSPLQWYDNDIRQHTNS